MAVMATSPPQQIVLGLSVVSLTYEQNRVYLGERPRVVGQGWRLHHLVGGALVVVELVPRSPIASACFCCPHRRVVVVVVDSQVSCRFSISARLL